MKEFSLITSSLNFRPSHTHTSLDTLWNLFQQLTILTKNNTVMVGPDKPAIPGQWLFQATCSLLSSAENNAQLVWRTIWLYMHLVNHNACGSVTSEIHQPLITTKHLPHQGQYNKTRPPPFYMYMYVILSSWFLWLCDPCDCKIVLNQLKCKPLVRIHTFAL